MLHVEERINLSMLFRDSSCRNNQLWLAFLFTCNLLGVAVALRTMHFQFAVWYYSTIPFLAWYAVRPYKAQSFIAWISRCAIVCTLTLAVEVSFLLTQEDTVSGPDGRSWKTPGTPTPAGSLLLTTTHAVLLLLLFLARDAQPIVTTISKARIE